MYVGVLNFYLEYAECTYLDDSQKFYRLTKQLNDELDCLELKNSLVVQGIDFNAWKMSFEDFSLVVISPLLKLMHKEIEDQNSGLSETSLVGAMQKVRGILINCWVGAIQSLLCGEYVMDNGGLLCSVPLLEATKRAVFVKALIKANILEVCKLE